METFKKDSYLGIKIVSNSNSRRVTDKLCKPQTAEKCEMLLAYHRDFLCQDLWGKRPYELLSRGGQDSNPATRDKQAVCSDY